jgi:Skp family chaperone for outer membrane proteins
MQLYSNCKSDSDQKDQMISNIQEKNHSLEEKIIALEKSLEEKERELADRKTQNSLLLHDKDIQNDAAKRKLASELSVEYRDFLSTLDVNMTVELGENMKGQITTIFSILKKYGVSF